MDEQGLRGAALPATTSAGAAALKEQQVQEIVGRLARGKSVSAVAATLGLDRKTVRAWRRQGAWRPRRGGRRRSILDGQAAWLRARAPEVGYNCAVLLRELRARGYAGSVGQVHRFVRPLRVAARQAARHATTINIKGESYRLKEKRRAGLLRPAQLAEVTATA